MTTLSSHVKNDFWVLEIQCFVSGSLKHFSCSSWGESQKCCQAGPTGEESPRLAASALLCPVSLSGRRPRTPGFPCPAPQLRTLWTGQAAVRTPESSRPWLLPSRWVLARAPALGCHSGPLRLPTPSPPPPSFPGQLPLLLSEPCLGRVGADFTLTSRSTHTMVTAQGRAQGPTRNDRR